MLVINITVATRTPLRTCFKSNNKSFSIFLKSIHSDLLKLDLLKHDEYAIVYQCSVPSNASNIRVVKWIAKIAIIAKLGIAIAKKTQFRK